MSLFVRILSGFQCLVLLLISRYFAYGSVGGIAIFASVSVCFSVCPLVYLKNHMSKLDEIFCICYGGCGSVLF